MEKRTFILLVSILSLFILPSVYAEISLQGPGKSVMNIGDEITMSGYLLEDTSMVALFKLILSCTTEQQLLVKSVSLTAHVQKTFSENLVIPSYLEGACAIKAVLESSGNIVDQASSPTFTLSRDLVGTFTLDTQEAKLGDGVTLNGGITKLDGTPFQGIATLQFKQGDTAVFVSTINVENGHFTYVYDTRNNPGGQYTIDVSAQDVYGNMKTFAAGTFMLAGEVLLIAQPDKLHYSPGDRIGISGDATILNQLLKDGKVTMTLTNVSVEGNVFEGKFSASIKIPFTITSGTQTIHIVLEDDSGNRGVQDISVIVDPHAESFSISQLQDSYLPLEIVKITPALLDQAGNVIQTDIAMIIRNTKGKDVFTDTLPSNNEYEFQIPEFALPGSWTLHFFAMDVEKDVSLMIGQQIILDYALGNETLYITNKGNIRCSGPIKISYKGVDRDFTFVKEFSLDSNETSTFNLAQGVQPGTYEIDVAGKAFKDVVITKKSLTAEGVTIIILGVIIVLLILLLIWYIKNWKNQGRKHPKSTSFIDQRKVVAAHKPRNDEEHVKSFKQKMATHVDTAKPKFNIKIKRKKEPDEYIYELPKKKERPPARPPRDSFLFDQSMPWGQPSQPKDDDLRDDTSYVIESENKKDDDESKKKKGLFNMFG